MDIHIDAVMRLHLSKNIEQSWSRYLRIYQSGYFNHLSSQKHILYAIKKSFIYTNSAAKDYTLILWVY